MINLIMIDFDSIPLALPSMVTGRAPLMIFLALMPRMRGEPQQATTHSPGKCVDLKARA